MMNRIYDLRFTIYALLCVLCVSVFSLRAQASTIISGTLSITNSAALTNATSGQSYTLNGDTRTFTNSLANPATQILVHTNDSATTILLNLIAQASAHPFTPIMSITTSGGTNVTFRATNDTALTITLSPTNWGRVTYATQTVGTVQTIVRVPLSADAARTNIASLLWSALDAYSQIRTFGLLQLTNGLTVAGNADFAGRTALNAGLALHGLAKTNSYTVTTNDLYIGVDTRSNTNLILTLPSAASASNLLFVVKDEGGAGATNAIRIYPASVDRIDTLLTNLVVSNNFGGVMLRSRGQTNWNVIASGGGVSGGFGGGGISGVPLTNTVWVAKNGNNGTATRGDPAKAYLTLGAAKTNAVSGDTIFVMPGTYDEKNLLKDGVNWHFFLGAKVIYTGSDTGSIFDDDTDGSNGAATSTITGLGEFYNHGSEEYYVIDLLNGSTVSMQARSLTSDDFVVSLGDGTLTLADCIVSGIARNPVIANGANIVFTATRCRFEYADAFPSNDGAAIYFYGANTNTVLRDCVLVGESGAGSPVAIKSENAGTVVRIDGGYTANLGVNANVSLVTDEDRWYAGGIPYNTVIHNDTNSAPFNIGTANFALDTYYTNGLGRAWVSASILLSSDATNTAKVSLYLDQDASGGFEQTGITASAQGAITNSIPLSAFVQPGARFLFTNLTSGGTAAASVMAGSSQWVKQ